MNTTTTIDRRRLLLGTGATAAGLGALSVLPAAKTGSEAAPVSLTPDERITAAIEEIKAAFWEKWPDAPLRIIDVDNIADGMVMVLSHIEAYKPGEVRHERKGLARLSKGGVS
ncbi:MULTISPECIES: hypothetical protein [unclassified Mesorhizobium]|uniref:hypothetical protein n=1 Tax=unclassified Mesorhizobium TaxID=325217 RepID=UPI000FCA1F09|nr:MULTISPECIES: hypothetical protein [unclassified Mesorhizobium]RUU59020.1 hypothetical protein EOC99_23360 [Mesorhizobium sp. M7A.T.Ca.TU.009.01.1.1]RUU81524.1 hypothetical protein EOD03_17270 [Mesorhizobium sp. M7A.T.Ca.TU.009.01.1.2]RUT88115.1 hypothetical protein EOD14_07885 [Mesorhizobium sp. M7A.T.Ca.US.000.02.1.1]RUT91878.1 hypothetical protein EOD15_12940 [Mesorhizobium sp. M7A.T.Ca.US.000.02.2.1]RUU01005.1 hypothetical protein EOD12_17445 [Mesorhizobium sp. M7A.T.Ca.TU.009.02.1.1]